MALKLKNSYEYQSSTLRRLIAEGKELGLSEEESSVPALREGYRRMRAVEEGRISGKLAMRWRFERCRFKPWTSCSSGEHERGPDWRAR